MRIGIYTFALNAEADIDDWMETTRDADRRVVLDIGSSDNTTPCRLQQLGIGSEAHFQPWRADDALNSAMALLPADIDVCIRLDTNERLQPNWRQAIDRAWTHSTTMLLYSYHWGRSINYIGDRVHRRTGYRWRGRAHERLIWCGDGDAFAHYCPRLRIDYLPRDQPKPFDLPLLEADAKEWPNDSDIALSYGRELIYQERFEDGKKEILRYLSRVGEFGPRSAYAFRLLAHADRENAMHYFDKAESAFSCPSNYLAMADYYCQTQQWRLCYTTAQYAFTLERSNPARLPADWGDDSRMNTSLLHELASIAAYNLWDFESAYGHAVEAVRRAPDSLRLRQHLNRVQDKIKTGATVSSAPAPIPVPMVRPTDVLKPSQGGGRTIKVEMRRSEEV